MPALEETHQTEESKFHDKARQTIVDMAGAWSPTERKNFVRSLVKDYEGLHDKDAEIFIETNVDLIQQDA